MEIHRPVQSLAPFIFKAPEELALSGVHDSDEKIIAGCERVPQLPYIPLYASAEPRAPYREISDAESAVAEEKLLAASPPIDQVKACAASDGHSGNRQQDRTCERECQAEAELRRGLRAEDRKLREHDIRYDKNTKDMRDDYGREDYHSSYR